MPRVPNINPPSEKVTMEYLTESQRETMHHLIDRIEKSGVYVDQLKAILRLCAEVNAPVLVLAPTLKMTSILNQELTALGVGGFVTCLHTGPGLRHPPRSFEAAIRITDKGKTSAREEIEIHRCLEQIRTGPRGGGKVIHIGASDD